MSGYNVVEITARQTRFMKSADYWTANHALARKFDKRENAQAQADALNTKHAAEAHWCKYAVRPSPPINGSGAAQ